MTRARSNWWFWLGAAVLLAGLAEAETKPSVRAFRIEKPVTVDGRLEEEVWQRAQKGTGFRQYDPGRGTPSTEKTEFAILYDRDHLYVGVWCWEAHPGKVMARSMNRDRIFTGSDFLYLFFDTYHDQRNGYVFAVNPTGAQSDALITNNTERNYNWDGIWASKARITEEGWFVEIAIPFKTVSFDPAGTVWGFNMSRRVRHRNESVRWAAPRDEVRTHNAAEAGDITGLRGMRQGKGIEFKPYLAGRYADGDSGEGFDGDVGADLRYRLTPSFSATVSYNTDFAETEVDQRVVNFTRFPLFFPEKRDFFLEDSGIYSFGPPPGFLRAPMLLPYFTRRIGLSDGTIVPINLATKLAGRVGDYDIGVTHALLDDHDGLDQKNVFAARVSKRVFEQSSVGVIATAGNPDADLANYVGGADYSFRTNRFLADKILAANVFGLGNHSELEAGGESSDYAFGASLDYPNDVWDWTVSYTEIGAGFDPALGFVHRSGIRAAQGEVRWKKRPGSDGGYREFAVRASTDLYYLIGGGLDSARFSFTPVDFEFASEDEFSLRIQHDVDRPREAFELADVIVPAGEYSWTSVRAEFETTSNRKAWFEAGVQTGQFYDGWRTRYSGMVEWNPNRHFGVKVDYQYNVVDLKAGDFDAHVGSVGVSWNVNPDLGWSCLAQYDSLSNNVGFNSRIRWEYKPGSTIYLVLNQALLARDGGPELEATDFTLKADATFRF